MKKPIILLSVLLICLTSSALAQLKPLNIIRDSIYSNILKEKRSIEIVLPEAYSDTAAAKYDAIYITDGEWNTQIVGNIERFLEIQFIPANIMVSLPNTMLQGQNMRGRDLTPTRTDYDPQSGGAARYIAFIKTELMPYINKKYRTTGMNTYYGGSLGGLFGMYTLIKEPRLFQSYLLADPSFWWDKDYLPRLVRDSIGKIDLNNTTLLITGREGESAKEQRVNIMDSIIQKAAPVGFHHKLMLYNDETHNSMIFRTMYDGLKLTYHGYSKEGLSFYPAGGVLMKDKPFKMRFQGDFVKELHYTTDGSVPTMASPKMDGNDLTLNNITQLNLKELTYRPGYEQQGSANFTIGNALPAGTQLKNFTSGGWNYAYYEGNWNTLPDFKKLKPLKKGWAGKDFDLTKLPKQQNFACVFSGQLEITQAGYYIFGLRGDCESRMYINNQLILTQQTAGIKSYLLPLQKGFYSMKVEYLEKHGKPSLDILYAPENGNGGIIPMELRYGDAK
ncbi:Predicted hydrolase of the alpha/beta superfamily [Mucilaginibacter lappiensis]|uniref:Alpha/beta superfamily hydrolase n=1 Tax=Mucilaginibacter lappiensis TaxID=354630 RepID=A0ABR6PDM4_9SPHI|nr:alpha/beta hydrolase-fold protein [Mucilaginibacter lappiensis]MBB6107867.1 putative alpha/beta superfamily hydrolase [Mucilaginibacter lappiensis]SIP94415.1 Predicted hydrolase of the alpha/beta superfamily [Mucilaginibacter lappiensis]